MMKISKMLFINSIFDRADFLQQKSATANAGHNVKMLPPLAATQSSDEPKGCQNEGAFLPK